MVLHTQICQIILLYCLIFWQKNSWWVYVTEENGQSFFLNETWDILFWVEPDLGQLEQRGSVLWGHAWKRVPFDPSRAAFDLFYCDILSSICQTDKFPPLCNHLNQDRLGLTCEVQHQGVWGAFTHQGHAGHHHIGSSRIWDKQV